MTARLFRYAVLIVATALALATPMRAQSGHELFQQALSKERAEGKLQEAIALYQRVVEVASADHALAARALLQLGRCYEQLGNAEARSAYERLIARYPDQADLVAQAKTRLSALVRTPPTAAAMTVQPLPDIGRDGELLAISPDRAKAIVMDYSKGQNIALYDFSKKQRRLLTDLNWVMGWTYHAVWSPDSRQVAYMHARQNNEVWELRVTTLDGRSRLVYRSEGSGVVQPVGWTPDGTTLLAVVARPDKTWVVGTVPATGGRFTSIRSFGWAYDYRDASPRLSPDGRFLAYLEGEKGLRDVHVVSLDGHDAFRITDDSGDDFEPIWSPDSRHLAFASNRLGSVSLWTVEVKDGKAVEQPVKLTDGMQSAGLVDWTERGIFYRQQTTTFDLYTVPMDPIAGRATGSPLLIPYSRTGRNVGPVWSPDGGRLAFVSSAAVEPNRRYVVVMSPDGGQAREFLIPTTTWQYSQSPYDLRWFGNGRGLGFSGTDNRGAPAVFRLLLDTGEWDTIPVSPERTRIEWNLDGSAFYFARRSGNVGIFEHAVSGGAERPVYRSSTPVVSIQSLEFSPDRTWLAFQLATNEGNYTGRQRLMVVDVETGEIRTVLENVINLAEPRTFNPMGWTPSGDLMVQRSGTGGTESETVLVPVNGNEPRSFAIPTFAPSGARETQPNVMKWSPTGRSMVLARERREHETFVIENPLAAVRAASASR
jgi:Tol biopolymer transport system component